MRYIVVIIPEHVLGGVDSNTYGVLDTAPASGPAAVIARVDGIATAALIRDALNA